MFTTRGNWQTWRAIRNTLSRLRSTLRRDADTDGRQGRQADVGESSLHEGLHRGRLVHHSFGDRSRLHTNVQPRHHDGLHPRRRKEVTPGIVLIEMTPGMAQHYLDNALPN